MDGCKAYDLTCVALIHADRAMDKYQHSTGFHMVGRGFFQKPQAITRAQTRELTCHEAREGRIRTNLHQMWGGVR